MGRALSLGFFWDGGIWTEEGMNERGNKGLQAMLWLLLIFRRHLAWIHWALWHATPRSVAPSGLQTLTMASLAPTVRGDIADVPQAGERNMPPILFTMSHPLQSPVFLGGHAQYFSSSWAQLGLPPDVLNLMREMILGRDFFFFLTFFFFFGCNWK